MANLVEHMMINKWDDDINEAITSVGGETYGSSGLPDYADIIKTQLVAKNTAGEGVYQDFLFIDEQNQTSAYPWDGEATDSTIAVQAKTIAQSIKELFDTMALTERFQVLLVDELPKSEINLSAVYLVQSKCDCGASVKENTYTGCYYVKTGKSVKKIEIPEFEVNLNELFYITRAEYEAGSSNIQQIEETLRKKFGKYWEDGEFTLEKEIEDILKNVDQKFIEQEEKFDQKYMNINDALTEEELNNILK